MAEGIPEGPAKINGSHVFATTHWSVIQSAKQEDTTEAAAALERLCAVYWRPLYAFVRRRGHSPHDAQDLTQEFFARLLAKDFLQSVDRSKGKFRSFLLAAMEHFLAKDWNRANAQKRGGGLTFVSADLDETENHYLQIPTSTLTPSQVFDQQCAMAILSQAVNRLREEFFADGKAELFEQTKVFLTGEKHAASYPELAAKLGTTVAALKMAVSRMRRRYLELLREEIAKTVSDRESVDEELRAIIAALG
jgi:RNA polymerase sigma factor (sigma-70 family)